MNRGCWSQYLILLLLTGCGCKLQPEPCIGSCKPEHGNYRTAEDIAALLRTEVNPPLNGLDKFIGGFTTSVFKNHGVFGWKDLGFYASVDGTVLHAAYSTDGFYTIDMRIHEFYLDGQHLMLNGRRYIRSEVCMDCISLPKDQWPRAGDHVRISGKLKWDADGFLEIHPQSPGDMTFQTRESSCDP